MKLKPEQLPAQLQRGLAPIYVISGDEPLLVMEAADAVRQCAREAGFVDRQVMNVERGFDWGALAEAASSMSLFAEQRLLELRLPTGKPGDAGAKALSAFAANPPPDTLLLVLSGKLDGRAQQSKWYKALEGVGIGVVVWPLNAAQLPGWIAARMRAKGMQPDGEAVAMLAERVEGNLLAAVQEIE